MILSHIGFTQECGMVLKLKRFSYLSGQSFGFGSPIRLEALSLLIDYLNALKNNFTIEKSAYKTNVSHQFTSINFTRIFYN